MALTHFLLDMEKGLLIMIILILIIERIVRIFMEVMGFPSTKELK